MCRSHIAGTMLSMPYFLLHLAWSPNRPPQRIPWRSGLEKCQKVSIELVLVRVDDAVGRSGIYDELGVFDHPCRSSAGGINLYDTFMCMRDHKNIVAYITHDHSIAVV